MSAKEIVNNVKMVIQPIVLLAKKVFIFTMMNAKLALTIV